MLWSTSYSTFSITVFKSGPWIAVTSTTGHTQVWHCCLCANVNGLSKLINATIHPSFHQCGCRDTKELIKSGGKLHKTNVGGQLCIRTVDSGDVQL